MANVGRLGIASKPVMNALTVCGGYESSVSITEGIAGTTSGVHGSDLIQSGITGNYQGGKKMSGAERGLSIVGGSVGLGMSFVGGVFQDRGATKWLQGGKTFSQYKASAGGTKTLSFIQTESGIQRISEEFHHGIITQEMQRTHQLPNWLANNKVNVW